MLELTVLMTTEGTYPYQEGGVSTWCDTLIRHLPSHSFVIASITGQPETVPAYELPPNARVINIPLWGTLGVAEIRHDLHWRDRRRMQLNARCTENLNHFKRMFATLVENLLEPQLRVHRLSSVLRGLAKLFATSDYDTLIRHRVTWDIFVHSTGAGLASLPAIVARVQDGTPFLLTEHGVYLRERLLFWSNADVTPFIKWFAMRVTRHIVELSLAIADMVALVSRWNGRWEEYLGASRSRIKPILNGVNTNRFAPQPMPSWERPTMVWVGRIDPIKDLFTLIDASAKIRAELPSVQTLLYGKAPAGCEDYEMACRSRIAALGLEQTVLFKGFSRSPEEAFAQGHMSVLSSISEGMPFSVVEAMLCGRPVVGTAVGGVPEILEEGGIVVPPRNPDALANACTYVLKDPKTCEFLGAQARAYAESNFSLRQCIQAYDELYRQLKTSRTTRQTSMLANLSRSESKVFDTFAG